MEEIGAFFLSHWWEFLLIIILLMCSAFFSGSETALYSIDKFRKYKLSLYNEKKYSFTKKLLSKPNELLVTILFGNMMVNIFLSTIIDNLLIGANEVLAISISTIVILIFGEVLPKFVSIKNSWNIALTVSKYLYYFSIVITPFRFILFKISKSIEKFLNRKRQNINHQNNEMSENDLKAILQMAIDDNIIPKDEAHLIENVLDFAELEVRNVMTPRINIFSLPSDISFPKFLFEIKRNRYTKIPIYKENLDNIVGIVHLKELIPYYRMSINERKNFKTADFIRKVYFVSERKPLKALLQDFINLKINIAIVIDEYGGTEGIVTLNDIIEQILGKFYEQDEEDNARLVSKISDDKYIVLGECTIPDFTRLTDIEIEDDDSETIAGYVLKKFDKIPKVGEMIKDGDCIFKIKNVNQNKIEQILIMKEK